MPSVNGERLSQSRSGRRLEMVHARIDELSNAAARFVPPGRIGDLVNRFLERRGHAQQKRDPELVVTPALALAADIALFAPSASGSTAIDRLARQWRPTSADDVAAMEALRHAQFRVARVEARESESTIRLKDLMTGAPLEVYDREIPASAVGLCITVRTGPLGLGSHIRIGPIVPIDEAAARLAFEFRRSDGNGLTNPQRCAEAVYRHVLRHGSPRLPGSDAPPSDKNGADPLDSGLSQLTDIVNDWVTLKPDTSPSASMVQRARDLTSIRGVLDALSGCVRAREDGRARVADAYAAIAAIQLETIRLREANGITRLSLAVVSDAIAHAIVRHGLPASVRALFDELRGRHGSRFATTTDNAELERLVARIQALRAKTVEQGCTEHEALAAAEKVAELLDRYGLSLNAIELRQQTCQGIGVETGRRRRAPIDDCVPSIAAFFDCRAWTEKTEGAPLRHIFFGLRADVTAAHYLYDLIVLAFVTETDGFVRDPFCAGLTGGELRRATHSFQIGLAGGIIVKLSRLREEREASLSSSGRDLVPLKSAIVDDEIARLGLSFRSHGRSRRRVIRDAYEAGHEAGSRFEIRPGLASAP